MNVFIFAVCGSFITLVNAVDDISDDTILKILKQKHKSSDYSNIDDTNASIEAIPIIPGFYLLKPKDLSKSLFENPKHWSGDNFDVLSGVDTKTRLDKIRNHEQEVKKSRDNYLKGKILKAVQNLNQHRDIQKDKDVFKKSNAYGAHEEPVQKLLGQVFHGIKGGTQYQGKVKYQKRQRKENEKMLGKILKSILYGGLSNKKYRESENQEYGEIEKRGHKTGDSLGIVADAVQYNDWGREGSELHQRLAIVVSSSEPLRDDDYESENNAKESMEVFDEYNDGSDPLSLYHTRRGNKPDIGSEEPSDSASSASSDYERNPGNPFTVHKNKYKQNWPYNHYMDGDHMNINPFGPKFGSLGPTGPELFFGRKWWYFNQDDYKPMR